jgi:hypothetical protein
LALEDIHEKFFSDTLLTVLTAFPDAEVDPADHTPNITACTARNEETEAGPSAAVAAAQDDENESISVDQVYL